MREGQAPGLWQAGGRPLAIAHAFGNRRDLLAQALQAGVDMVEADVWLQGGRFWARHERRLGPLPLLLDRRRYASHGLGPWALPLGPFYLRLELDPLPLEEVLQALRGRALLLWDVKKDLWPGQGRHYARHLGELLARLEAADWVMVCSREWDLLEAAAEAVPGLTVFYTVETPQQWDALLRLPFLPQGVTIHHSLADEARTAYLRERGLPFLCWTVDEREEAERLLSLGARGIISNRLGLLRWLKGLSVA